MGSSSAKRRSRKGLTQTEAAKRLGITPRQLRTLSGRGVVSRLADGSYPWPQAEEDYEAFTEESKRKRDAGFGDESYERARARKTAAQAELAEVAVAEKRRQLIPLTEVHALVRKPLEAVDAALKNAPSRHASSMASALGVKVPAAMKALQLITEEIRGELRGLADNG